MQQETEKLRDEASRETLDRIWKDAQLQRAADEASKANQKASIAHQKASDSEKVVNSLIQTSVGDNGQVVASAATPGGTYVRVVNPEVDAKIAGVEENHQATKDEVQELREEMARMRGEMARRSNNRSGNGGRCVVS